MVPAHLIYTDLSLKEPLLHWGSGVLFRWEILLKHPGMWEQNSRMTEEPQRGCELVLNFFLPSLVALSLLRWIWGWQTRDSEIADLLQEQELEWESLEHPSWEDKLVCRQQFAFLKCMTRTLQSAMNSFLLFPDSYPALAIQIRYPLCKNITPKLHLSPCFSLTWLKCFVRWLGDQCLNYSHGLSVQEV